MSDLKLAWAPVETRTARGRAHDFNKSYLMGLRVGPKMTLDADLQVERFVKGFHDHVGTLRGSPSVEDLDGLLSELGELYYALGVRDGKTV